ncbi:AEC family transporter [Conexibacter woesei]|uniref:Auxin Efflux Carrier n=1 Tax=Conexibacter woesei (strain DSM 14684 / CCUG 47730 / CIP 108061 / JCM 11494 / NBRC 100937 / ID131577) TaxID=469383 RepID=D3F9I4_CONWI|nr:AEC family transporter [Conexibacter woesei]ADB49151.1 Auxin Efflux Carrier [Conexibacter woesei DSM 14684]
MIAIVGTVVLAVAAGVLLERRTAPGVAHRIRHALVQTMLWVLMPFVAYVNIARLHLTADVGFGLVLAICALAGTGVLMWLLARGPLGLDRPATGAAIVCVIQANTGFFSLPLAAALFSQRAFAQAVAYDVLVSAPAFALGSFTVGALFGTAGEGRRGDRWRMGGHVVGTLLRNPVGYVMLIALAVPEAWAPEVLVTPSRLAVFALLPLGFIVVGITLADEAEDGTLRVPPPLTRPVAVAVVLRMAVMPLLLIGISALVIDLPPVYALLAAAPAGVNTVLVAHRTGLDLRLTASAIAWTTAIALVGVLGVSLLQALSVL